MLCVYDEDGVMGENYYICDDASAVIFKKQQPGADAGGDAGEEGAAPEGEGGAAPEGEEGAAPEGEIAIKVPEVPKPKLILEHPPAKDGAAPKDVEVRRPPTPPSPNTRTGRAARLQAAGVRAGALVRARVRVRQACAGPR